MATPEPEHLFRGDLGYYEDRAAGLRVSAEDGTASALARFERWGEPASEAGARVVVAREHGLGSWADLADRVAHLDGGGEPFARAYRALEAHDPNGLRAELDRSPELVSAAGTNGNDLLGMATATCDERLVELLLARGADVGHANAHGWTALHQAAYSGLPALARMLLDAGAAVDTSARGDGGTPMIVALFWGHGQTAELLAERGVWPRNLRAAAALGRTDLIDELVTRDGRLAPEAGEHRSFYRPHSGFPAWRPSDDSREILDEALSWAARNDRAEAVELLIARGSSVDADVYRGTPLAWAAAAGRINSLRRLLGLGADPNARTSFGGPDHGADATALHLAAQGGRLDVIGLLLDAGADPTIHDTVHHSTPAGWAEHGGMKAACDLLREHGG